MRLGVLVSGRGSNLSAVLAAVADGRLLGVEPLVVVSNRRSIPALEAARAHGVPTVVLRRSDFGGDAAARDAAIGQTLTRHGVELALLAGYDQVLRPTYFHAFRGRTLNIHPSLLPAHGGRGMLGLAVHRSVLAAGDRETGVSIHEVTEAVDAGPVIASRRLGVRPGEVAEELAQRVLEVEHLLLVGTLARLATDRARGMPSATMTAAAAPATLSRRPAEDS